METRREMAERLDGLGVTGSALEALLRETGRARHAWRVEQTIAAALAASDAVCGNEPDPSPGREGLALIVLLADLAGIGGRDGCEGRGTARHPAFRALGAGRKQAADGGAWLAAVPHAVATLAARVGAERLTLAPGAGGCVELWDDAAPGAGGSRLLAADPGGLLPPAWQRTLAREGLRRAAGLDPWFSELPCRFAGEARDGLPEATLAAWAALVNLSETELRREAGFAALVIGDGSVNAEPLVERPIAEAPS